MTSSKNIIGSRPDQIPTNGMLGTLAYQNAESVKIEELHPDLINLSTSAFSSVSSPPIVFNANKNTGIYLTDTNLLSIVIDGTGVASYGKGEDGDPDLTIFGPFLSYNLQLDKRIIASGTTGAATINSPAGVVNFGASDTSLVVTNSLVDTNSIVIATVGTNDSTMKAVQAVCSAGSFTLYPDSAPTGETRVNFIVIN